MFFLFEKLILSENRIELIVGIISFYSLLSFLFFRSKMITTIQFDKSVLKYIRLIIFSKNGIKAVFINSMN